MAHSGQPGLPSEGSRVAAAIERWQRELLDLSRNNRLLHFQSGSGRRGQGGVAVQEPAPRELFDRLANKERRQTVARPAVQQPLTLDLDDEPDESAAGGPLARATSDEDSPLPLTTRVTPVRGRGGDAAVRLRRDEILLDVEPARLDALLYRLRLRARSARLEQGIDILYVAFGLLDWTLPNVPERLVSPLLLLPVRLDRKRSVDPYTLTPLDEPPILNPALTFQLESAYQVTLTLPDAGENDLDYPATLQNLQEQLAVLPDWTVQDGAFVGLFSFAKQAMYADLAANRTRLLGHPVVRALAGEPGGLTNLILPDPAHLDELEHPRDTFQVLDADASQRTVLAAIRKGGNLVVQGPPGTGKSQTIANAIAEALARGKTVLFVSEKLAALQVVAKRLRAAGLGEFCLEAHGHGGDKKAIVTSLAGALPQTAHTPSMPSTDELTVLAERRAALNAYAQAIHDARNPLGASAFDVHGELAQRASAPRTVFDVPSIGAMTGEKAMRLLDLVRRLVPLAGVVTAPEQHPWHGCILTRWTPLLQAQLETTLDRLARAADELADIQARAGARWGLSLEPSLAASRWLLQTLTTLEERPPILARWLERPDLTVLTEQTRLWGVRCQGYNQRRLMLLSHYQEGIFALDLPAIISAIERVEVAAIDRLRGDGPAVDRALASRATVEQTAGRVRTAIPAALAATADVAATLGMAAPVTRPELERVLRVADLIRSNPHPEAGWLQPGQPGVLADLAEDAARQVERARANRAALLERFDEGILTAIIPELALRFETTYTSWLRQLRPGWYADIGLLRRHLRPERAADGLDYATAMAAIGHWRELTAADGWLASQAPVLAGAFGRHYHGARTDWAAVQGALGVVRQLGEQLGDVSRWQKVARLLLEPGAALSLDSQAEALRAALAELDAALAALNRIASPAHGGYPGGREEGAVTLPLPEIAADLERWLAALAPLWAASDALHACRRHVTTSAADLLTEARDALTCHAFEADFGAAMPGLASDLGPFFQGLRTEWPRILTALSWSERIQACFERQPPASFVAAVDTEPAGPIPERSDLHRALGRLQELRAEIGTSFARSSFARSTDSGPWIGSQPIDRATLPAVAAWARDRHAALQRLQEWIDARLLLRELDTAGLGGFVEALRREAPPPAQWEDAFRRQMATLWLTWRYEHAPALAQFRRESHEGAVAELRALDRKQWEIAGRRIAEKLLAQRPARAGVASSQSEVGLLLREELRRRRFKPLRRLFAELPHLLPTLKPCLLMSPLSVAQHLGESAVTFDLVIFDEASQILPADAIGAIGRGRQVVVVGDRRQLPPTRFFQVTSLNTATDDADEEPPESVLDACLNAGVPECSLLWHYRSRHEHLIAFSNAAFYEGRLRTFPSPDADERVVTFQHVPNGVYDRGHTRANHVEAVAVADLVVAHVEAQARQPASLRQSLGVIAFSEAQMLAILAELEARKRERPELEPLLAEEGPENGEERLFVKNLESVQGDERDAIVFSIGYGPDADGRLTMNFGPLNLPGGERRLNVAVTRARRRLTVVASIHAHQIDGSPQRPAGVRELKRYLEYAEHGPGTLLGAAVGAGSPASERAGSPFEQAVQAALSATLKKTAGMETLSVVAGVGVGTQPVDLAVREASGRYLLAIECDGQTYRDLPTARDRDRLRQEVLSRLGWPIHRVWSTDWVVGQREEEQRLLAAIERGRQLRDGLILDDETPLAVLKPEDRPTAHGRTRPDQQLTTPYAAPKAPSDVTTQDRDDVTPQTQDDLTAQPSLPQTAAPLGLDGSPRRRGEGEPVEQRSTSAAIQTRPIDQVDDAEIAVAIRAVLMRELAMPRDPLIVAAARELGYRRTGAQIRARAGRVVNGLVQSGVLVEVGGNLRLTPEA